MNFYQDIIIELTRYFVSMDICSQETINSYIASNEQKRTAFCQEMLKDRTGKSREKMLEQFEKHRDEKKAGDMLRLYFHLMNHQIKQQKYHVSFSDTLLAQLDSNQFDFDIKRGVESVANELERGIDVNGRLTKKARRLFDKKGKLIEDPLLNDWNIYHLHLGKEKEKLNSYYYTRTKELLMVYISYYNKHAYFLKIEPFHAKAGEGAIFADQDLEKIMIRNWPKIVEKYRLFGVSSTEVMTDQERLQVRRNNLNYADNGVMPLGGGLNADGSSTNVQLTTQKVLKDLGNLQADLQKRLDREFSSQKTFAYVDYKLVLNIQNNAWNVIRFPDCADIGTVEMNFIL